MKGLVPFNRKNSSLLNSDFEDFYDMIDDFFSGSLPSRRSLTKDTFKVDIQETDNEYLIEAEVPGVKKEEIGLNLTDGRLTISIKREEKADKDTKNYIHRERHYLSMSRSMYLSDAKPDDIKAKLDNGVLTITVKKQDNKTHPIDINIE